MITLFDDGPMRWAHIDGYQDKGRRPMRRCYVCDSTRDVRTCDSCGEDHCESHLFELDGRLLCPVCLDMALDTECSCPAHTALKDMARVGGGGQ